MTTLLIAGAIMFALAALFATLLTIASVKLAVKEDPRVIAVLDVLPMANCGACGFAGCADFAKAVVAEKAEMTGCPVGGQSLPPKIAAVLGREVVETFPYRPVVHCGARHEQKLGRVDYDGVQSCVEANVIGVTQGCVYGCLGFGDCLDVCDYDAMRMENGLPVFDYDKCTGCGACERDCPRNIIARIPFKLDKMIVVACSNPEGPKQVKEVCKVGCVGCRACSRMMPDLFHVPERLATIDYDAYTGEEDFAAVKAKCPTGVIVYFGKGQPGMVDKDAGKHKAKPKPKAEPAPANAS